VRDDVGVSEDRTPFVEKVRIQNFGCVRDVTLELTRLHALIGPNDSGKSTVLRAVHSASELVGLPSVEIHTAADKAQHMFELSSGSSKIAFFQYLNRREWYHYGSLEGLAPSFRGANLVRWDPDVIRQSCILILEGNPLVVGERGENLASIYEAILSRDRSAFTKIEREVQRLFPTVESIWLPTMDSGTKSLGVILKDGTKINSGSMSEGLLYWLAFAVLPYADPTSILLVEEPENGLHPSRIAEVMTILRAISQTTQVILATHSPLVINELRPDEVTILTRDEKTGTRATRMDRTKHFQQRQKVYALGELWLSFADGDAEEALIPNETATAAS
jgi:predicted ATPase